MKDIQILLKENQTKTVQTRLTVMTETKECVHTSNKEHVDMVHREEVAGHASSSTEKFAHHTGSMVNPRVVARRRKTVNFGTHPCAINQLTTENV